MSSFVSDHYLMEAGTWHYTSCGLDCVYLQNGFNVSEDGKSYSIDDLEELHECIAFVLTVLAELYSLTSNQTAFLNKHKDVWQSSSTWICIDHSDPNKLIFQNIG